MTRAELIQYITDNVYPNARNEVTAPMVRDSLLEIVDFLGDAATYNIGMVASGNQGLVTGGNVNTAIALALLPYYTAAETGQAIDDAIARIGLGQAAYKNIGQVAENNTDLVTGGQVYTAINTALTSAIKFQGISDTPLTDGSTTNPIQINGQSYTAKKGDMVVYGGNEFLWVGNKWQQMGDESSYALKTIQITGTGYLTGGGDLTQSRTLDISATAKGYIDHGEAAYNYFPGGVLGSTHLPSMYIGTTSVQFTAVAQNLTGISSVRATTNVMTLFEWDSTNSAWHFHGNIYTDGWFSGGGISPGGGGGGGGIDPVAMWRLLTNDPSLTQYDNYTKISADHINFPVTSVVGLTGAITKQQIAQALNLGSFAYKNSLTVSDIPDLSGMYLKIDGTNRMTAPLYLQTERDGNWNVPVGDGSIRLLTSIHTQVTGAPASYQSALSVQTAYNGFQLSVSGDTSSTDLLYRHSGDASPNWSSWYNIYHSGNSNKSDVPWTCSTLTSNNGVEAPILLFNTSSAIARGNYITGSLGPHDVALSANDGSNYREFVVFASAMRTYCPIYQNGNQVLDGGQNTVMRNRGNLRDTASVGYAINDVNNWVNVNSGYGGFNYPYGTSIMIVGEQTWYNRLDFGTNGVVDLWQGINTTTMSKVGHFWTSANAGAGYAWACTTLEASSTIYATTGIYTDGWFSGGGLASSSDRRLKKNIKNFGYTPKLLLAIRPREWDWKDGSAMVGHAAGFVAQEIEPIMPYAVDGTRNYKALFYDRFHALEISALQDHERRIKALEDENEKIRRENIELKKRLNMN